MAEEEQHAPAEIRQAAQALLTTTLGAPIELDAGQALSGRTYVYRFALCERPADAPQSVIAKLPRLQADELFNPDANEGPALSLFDDWAALQFLSQIAADAPVAPRYLAGDRARGLFVLEDLGAGESIDTFLLGSDPPVAEDALLELVRTLGRMHARSIGRQEEYNQLRDALGPRRAAASEESHAALAPAFLEALTALEVAPAPGLAADLQTLLSAISDPGPFLAYTHGDPCPDNCLRVNGQIRLIDFERGAFRHALMDGVYGRIHFPTCWCVNRLPELLPLRMEEAYRAELVQGCAAAADDLLFRRAVVDACGFWALVMCNWFNLPKLLVEDGTWGIATLRQRVLLRAPIVAQLTAESGYLEALGATFGALADKLGTVWPSEANQMPLYPAFRPQEAV